MEGWALATVCQVGQIVDVRIPCICETSIDFFIKRKLTWCIINLVEFFLRDNVYNKRSCFLNFCVEISTVLILGLLFLE
jgi:hypothetical protein